VALLGANLDGCLGGGRVLVCPDGRRVLVEQDGNIFRVSELDLEESTDPMILDETNGAGGAFDLPPW